MVKNDVLISVIIPIYNDELYLEAALESIQQQTYTNFECICVNDGSSDESEAIIDIFVKKDCRFIKINRSNGGVSAARNTGLDAAKGDYIFMMDHDDLTPTSTLEKLLAAALKYDADLTRGRMMMIPDNFTLNELPVFDSADTTATVHTNPLTDYYKYVRGKYKNWYYIWVCLYKHSSIKGIRFNEALRSGGEDYLFIFDVVGIINNFVQIEEIVACHRHSKISTMLNGFNPKVVFHIAEVIIPYIYQTYLLQPVDKRLRWWVYHKEAYAIYRFLIRNPIRNFDLNVLEQAHSIVLKHQGTPAFKEILKHWSLREQLTYSLFMKKKFKTIRRLKFLL